MSGFFVSKKIVAHSLRHTFANWLVEAGVDLYTVKELMGHSVIAMTGMIPNQ